MQYVPSQHISEIPVNASLSVKELGAKFLGFRYVNALFGNLKLLGHAVLDHCKSLPEGSHIRIVDLGCGSGDGTLYLAKKLAQHRIKATLVGVDSNPKSIAYAFKQSRTTENVTFVHAALLKPDFEIPSCDILISSHFIGHFKHRELVHFLNHLQTNGVHHIIFSELQRSKLAHWLFRFTTLIVPLNKAAKKYGLLAIQRTFTPTELKQLIGNSGLKQFKVIRKPFFKTLALIDL